MKWRDLSRFFCANQTLKGNQNEKKNDYLRNMGGEVSRISTSLRFFSVCGDVTVNGIQYENQGDVQDTVFVKPNDDPEC